MVEALIFAIGLVIAVATLMNYQRTRDPLCAMVIFAPLMLYFYVYHPLAVLRNPEVELLVGSTDQFTTTAIVYLLSVSAFCLGCATARRTGGGGRDVLSDFERRFSSRGRAQVYAIAVLLGLVSVSIFSWLIWRSGGFVKVFMSGGKPNLSGGASGYIGELPMLSYPAMLLLAVSRQGLRVRMIDWCAYLFCASPQIVWATFGGRRGPMFLLAMTLAASWMIVRSKRPKLVGVLAGLTSIGMLIVFLAATRQSLYFGSEKEFSFTDITETLTGGSTTLAGDEFICGYAVIEASSHFNRHYWGHRFLVQLFVRPIPRQVWKSKYDDTGLTWMAERAGSAGFEQSEWIEAVGFETAGGSAAGFVADLFLEFSWGCVAAAFVLGWFYSHLWTKSHREGGYWTVLYYISLILSIYLVAQSVISAWGYRMLLLGVPTYLIWRRVVDRRSRYRYRPDPPPSREVAAGQASYQGMVSETR